MRKSTKICAALGVVAGLGVAVAPLSVFADTPTRTDTLHVTVNEACTVNATGIGEALAVENDYDVTLNPGQELEMNVGGGSTNENFFTIQCNYPTGYRIVANVTGEMTGQETANTGTTIPAATPWTNGDDGTSYWAAKLTKGGNLTSVNGEGWFAITSANQRVAYNESGSAVGGDTFKMSYKVGASSTLKAGSYKGTVAYTLVRGATE